MNHDSGDVVCNFCWRGHEIEDIAGKLHASNVEDSSKVISAHHKCMQYASDLAQYKFDSFGGFVIDEVEKEIQRGSKLKCFICKGEKGKGKKATGACCGCAVKSCRKTFHFPCAYGDPVAITKRLVVTKNKRSKKYILYRVFCSAAHEEVFRVNIKEELRSKKDFDDSSGGEKEEDDVSFSKAFSPHSFISVGKNTSASLNGSESSLDKKPSLSESEDSFSELKSGPHEDSNTADDVDVAERELTDDQNTVHNEATSIAAKEKLDFAHKGGRRSMRVLALTECSPIPEEPSILNESDLSGKLESPLGKFREKHAVVVLEDCGTSDPSKVSSINGSNESDSTSPAESRKMWNAEKGRRTKSSPSKHAAAMQRLELAEKNTEVDVEQLNSGEVGGNLSFRSPAKTGDREIARVAAGNNGSPVPLKCRTSPRSADNPNIVFSVTAEVHTDAHQEEEEVTLVNLSDAPAAETDRESDSVSLGVVSGSSGCTGAEEVDQHVTSAGSALGSASTRITPSVALLSSDEDSYVTATPGSSRKRKTLDTCCEPDNSAVKETPSKRRENSISLYERQTKKVNITSPKGMTAKTRQKSAEMQDNTVGEELAANTSLRNYSAVVLVFPGNLADFETIRTRALEAVAAEFNTHACSCMVHDFLQGTLSPDQLIFFVIDVLGLLKNGDLTGLEQLLFNDKYAKERARVYDTQGQIFKVLNDDAEKIFDALWRSIDRTSTNLATQESGLDTPAKVLCVEGRKLLAVCLSLFNSSDHLCARLKAKTGLYRWNEETSVTETFPQVGMERRHRLAELESLVLEVWLRQTADVRKMAVFPNDHNVIDRAAVHINRALTLVMQSFQNGNEDRHFEHTGGDDPNTAQKPHSTHLLVFQPVEFMIMNFQQYFQKVVSKYMEQGGVTKVLAVVPVTNFHSLTWETVTSFSPGTCPAAEFSVEVSSAFDPNKCPTQLVVLAVQKVTPPNAPKTERTERIESSLQPLKRPRGRPRRSGKID